jgi:hypothetical protein
VASVSLLNRAPAVRTHSKRSSSPFQCSAGALNKTSELGQGLHRPYLDREAPRLEGKGSQRA